MHVRSLFRIVPALVAAAVLAACTPPTEVPSPGTIAEIAAGNDSFTTLVAALTEAGLVGTFADADAGPFTVFAPTNAAFEQFLTDAGLTAAELLASPDLADILRYHVVPGTFLAADVIAASPFDAPTLLEGETIDVAVAEGTVVLNDSVNVVDTDIIASNGVIHVIDYVLMPLEEVVLPTIAEIAAGIDGFTTLVAALTEAGLVGTFADADAGPFTVFAPTNAAFEQFLTDAGLTAAELLASPDLADILRYHVVPGTFLAADVIAASPFDAPTLLEGETIDVAVVEGTVVLNDSVNVVDTDIIASNGVIHVIDYVLTPPEEVLPTIAEIAADDENFSTLVAALTEAGLVDTFADAEAGPFTVFAPTNAAFEALLELLETDLEGLLALPNLGDILAYHVVPGEVYAEDVIGAAPFSPETLLTGATISVTLDGEVVVLNGTSNVTATDIAASNGVIHVIDEVLLPIQ